MQSTTAFARLARLLLCLLPIMLIRAVAGQTTVPHAGDFFESEVRPLLVQRCYGCHSGTAPKGNLRLDSRAGWQRGGTSGTAITPGDADNSLLLKAVRHAPGVTPMPPGPPLSEHEIAVLAQWIKQGAFDPRGPSKSTLPTSAARYWAFQPIRHVAPPAVKNAAWARTPIDRFLLAGLEARGLVPNPPADRRTFIRRATYDLLGLPPTPREVSAFLADTSPQAYEILIDRLLASPHYGEKWGRHWLDVVHYGDTHGYDKDKRRDHAWPYRDYVIHAFNEDKPYAQFIQEQIAGDVLASRQGEEETRRQGDKEIEKTENGRRKTSQSTIHYPLSTLVATGFLAAGPWDFVGNVELREGTVEKEKTRLIDRDDMVSTVMSTFTSLTVHCARCHDHKFDPIPQQDYYRLQAVFAGIDRGDRAYDDARVVEQRNHLEQQTARLTARQEALLAKVRALTSPELSRLEGEIAAAKQLLVGMPLPTRSGDSPTNGYHSAIAAMPAQPKWVQVDLGRSVPVEEIRLIPARPTDFADTPGFGFPVRFQIVVSEDAAFAHAFVVADQSRADFPNPGVMPFVLHAPPVAARYVRVTATRLWPRTNDYIFALAEMQVLSHNVNVAQGRTVTALDSIESGRWSARYLVDNFDSRHPLPDLSDPSVATLVQQRRVVEQRLARLEQAQQTEREAHTDVATRTEREQIELELTTLHGQIAALPPASLVYSVLPHAPRPIYVLARGEVEQKGLRANPGALRCVPSLESDFHLPDATDEGQGRLALAEWIASPKNMLTWRSIVNRVWHYHFGQGLVATPNDFGRNGARPTHPELLDWLASNFKQDSGKAGRAPQATPLPSTINRASTGLPEGQQPSTYACGGSLKKLHRLIMLSAAYRQASTYNPAGAKVDADNHLLWRMNRRRLEAEEIRDSVLAISGKLDIRQGGPGFEVFGFKDDHSPIYDFTRLDKIRDPATFRRTIYEFNVRSVPNPFLAALDSPDPSSLTPVRNTTLTALQALALWNDPFMVQQSVFLAERLTTLNPDKEKQLEQAYGLVLGRKPTASERKALIGYAQKHGLANACRLLFNTNEFVFID